LDACFTEGCEAASRCRLRDRWRWRANEKMIYRHEVNSLAKANSGLSALRCKAAARPRGELPQLQS
jgi:hypothetical protein